MTVTIPRGTEKITRIGIETGKSENKDWETDEVEFDSEKSSGSVSMPFTTGYRALYTSARTRRYRR